MRRWQLGLTGALLTGLLLTLVFPRWNFTWLAPIALTPLLYSLAHEPSWKRRFLLGWITGTVFWGATCYWIQAVLAHYGGLNLPLSWLAQTLFALAKGLLIASFAALSGFLIGRRSAIPMVAALWTGIERLNGPQGFAWLTLGNAGIDMGVPLRLAPLVGVYGLSFLFAAFATALTLVLMKRDRRDLVWLIAVVGLAACPAVILRETPAQSAAVLQPNIPMEMNWTESEKQRVVRQLSMLTLAQALDTRSPRPGLIVWPEVPAPFYFYADAQFRDHVSEVARLAGAPFLVGTVAFTTDARPLNSAVMIGANGRPIGRYDKINLVPFGEFVPPLFGWIEKISSEAGTYEPGSRIVTFPDGGHTFGAFICYESAFPDLVRQFAAEGAEVLVNLTNDGYFFRSAAREQHLLLARMRAVENNRWLLRVTNDGTTVSVDPAGRVWDSLQPFQQLAARLRFGWIKAQTPYTRWGDWFAWVCLAAGLLSSLLPSFYLQNRR